jgi:hypothetical protein
MRQRSSRTNSRTVLALLHGRARIELAKSFDTYIDTLVKALRNDVAV